MKKSKYSMIWFGIAEMIVGLALLGCSYAGLFSDSFWSGMGTALAVMGVIFLVRGIRYRKDKKYKEELDTEVNDERNKFLSMKAWSWAGYLYMMIAAVAAIVLKVLHFDEYVMVLSGSICLILILYVVIYQIIRKKY